MMLPGIEVPSAVSKVSILSDTIWTLHFLDSGYCYKLYQPQLNSEYNLRSECEPRILCWSIALVYFSSFLASLYSFHLLPHYANLPTNLISSLYDSVFHQSFKIFFFTYFFWCVAGPQIFEACTLLLSHIPGLSSVIFDTVRCCVESWWLDDGEVTVHLCLK